MSGDLENIPRSRMLTFVCSQRLCRVTVLTTLSMRSLSLFHCDSDCLLLLVLPLACCVVYADTSLLSSMADTNWARSPAHVFSSVAMVAYPEPSAVTLTKDTHYQHVKFDEPRMRHI